MINNIVSSLTHVDRILFVSDIHMRNWKRHTEFKEIIDKLLKVVDSLPTDSIVALGGDIVHAKTDISPELISMVSYLFNELANRRPTIVICGNHDTNLNNSNRLDALTPIVEAIKHPNLYYLRNSGLYEIGDIVVSVMSLLDEPSSYVTADMIPQNKSYKHLVAMYHGTVANSVVDSGLVLSHGLDWSTFANFDLVLLGDIHKRQVLSKSDPIMFYVGSLVQQNFGESFEGHGYSIIDLQEKGNIKYDFQDIQNDYGYYTIDVEGDKIPAKLPITNKTTVRLRTKNTNPAELKRLLATIKRVYRNKDVTVQVMDKAEITNTQSFGESIYQGDVRNTQYQSQLITEFLQRLSIDNDLIEAVLEINKSTNQAITQGEVARNIVWKPKKFEFSNMFSYAEDNVVDFAKLEGSCGLFAPNHAGKSAVLDALCFCLFDQSQRASKANQVLNKKKDSFYCKLNFELGGLDYYIEKKATKYTKGPLAGKLRVDINFWYVDSNGVDISLNGEQRRDTDKNIQSYVGSFDDFVLTALSLQGSNSNFIDKSQADRKDLLANFLDLKIFDTLYEIANKESRSITIVLEEYQKQDFETRLGDAERLKDLHTKKHQQAQLEVESCEINISTNNDKLLNINKAIQPCSAEGLDIVELTRQLDLSESRLLRLEDNTTLAESLLVVYKSNLKDAIDANELKKSDFNSDSHQKYLSQVLQKQDLDNTLAAMKINIKNKLTKLEKLKEHKYDPNCLFCISNVFVKDAIDTEKQLETDKQTVHSFLQKLQEVALYINQNKHTQDQFDNLKIAASELDKYQIAYERQQNVCVNYGKDVSIETHKRNKLKDDITAYNDNKTILSNNKSLYADHKLIGDLIKGLKIELSRLNNVVKDLHGKISVADQVIADSNARIQHMQELADSQAVYDLYCKAMGKDGIPYLLISKAVPYIQEYVNSILSQVIDFTVELETDGKNINVWICYDDARWPLELSSGMEKFMSGLAIRIALIKITNLPKPDFIAIDEGLGVLDSTNLNSMHTLFNYMKDVFRFSLIISHIDVVRDMVDSIITIDKKEDFSHINC